MKNLPSHWAVTTLNSVSKVVRGITFPASAKEQQLSESNVCCLRTSNVQQEIDWKDIYFVDRSYVKRSEQFVQPGDVLMSMANSYELVGKVAIAKEVPYPTAFGAFLSAVRPTSAIDGKYLFHLLRTHQVQSELRRGSSQTTNIANISVGTLSSIEIPLAPLPEQKRIADKLDAVLARLNACRERLDRVPLILKRFRQSVLAAATSGRLTEDWRRDAPISWQKHAIDSLSVHISDGPFGSNLKSDDYTRSGARVVRLENIGHLRFEADKATFVSLEKYAQLSKYTLQPGDLLFSSFVDEEVRVCEFPSGIDTPAINKADCFCIRVDLTKCDRKFLMLRLACRSTYQDLKDLVHGATRPRINLKQLRNFEIALPDLSEQREIVRRVETLFAFADRIEARLVDARNATDRLTPALLAKAFRGELVPQNPDDEPAAELLKRIAAQKVSSKPARKRKALEAESETA